MSTANFVTMDKFDLYAFDTSAFDRPVCPECGAFLLDGQTVCDLCGSAIEDTEECETEYDIIADLEFCKDVDHALEELNDLLRFFELRLASGYYTDYQIAVLPSTKYGLGSYDGYVSGVYRYDTLADYDPHNLDNDETRDYYGLCRSEAIRKYDVEARRVCRWMKGTLPGLGFDRIVCVGSFSNGEAVYEIAGREAKI